MNTPPLHIQHTVLARLGGEHIAHAISRRGAGGDRVLAWGDRILEWPLDGTGATTEVVPRASPSETAIQGSRPANRKAGKLSVASPVSGMRRIAEKTIE